MTQGTTRRSGIHLSGIGARESINDDETEDFGLPSARAESGVGESATKTLCGRELEVLQRVVDAADVEPGMTTHDLVRTCPDGFIGHQPLTVGLAQVGRIVHD